MSINLSKCMPKLKRYQQSLIRFYSQNPKDELSPYERDERGPIKKLIHGAEYPSWTTPIVEASGYMKSKFSIFKSDSTPSAVPFFIRLKRYPLGTWGSSLKQLYSDFKDDTETKDQEFSSKRVSALGWDLAAATFICYRGGAVKFVEGKEWIRMTEGVDIKKKLPTLPTPGLLVECIDCEGFYYGGLRYAGLLNLQNLDDLKWLSLKGNRLIDDWGLDRLSGIMSNKSLEYLDLRGCPVTHRGVQILYRIPTLRLLVLDGKTNDEDLDYTCAMLQELMPDLLIKFD